MSGHLELYRTTVNLRGLGSGTEIEIDPTDEAWAGDIGARRIVPIRRPGLEQLADPIEYNLASGRAVSETYLTDVDEPDCEVGPEAAGRFEANPPGFPVWRPWHGTAGDHMASDEVG